MEEREEYKAVFKSKVDGWLAGLLGGVILLVPLLGLYLLFSGEQAGGLILLAVSLLDLFMLSLFFPIRYKVGTDQLRVKMGYIEHAVRLETIERVVPRTGFRFTWGISAALSLDALEVHYCRGRRSTIIVVSPRDQRAFLDVLRTSEPALRDKGAANWRATCRDEPLSRKRARLANAA